MSRLMQFLKDYYNVMKHHLDDGLSEQIPRFPTMKELRAQAEQSFINSYGLYPSCAVYAPGCLTIAGKSTDLAESKSLSMVGANSSVPTTFHCESRFSPAQSLNTHFRTIRGAKEKTAGTSNDKNTYTRVRVRAFCLRLSSPEIKQAIQLVTLVVGKRSRDSNWCQARTLSDEIAEETALKLAMNNQNLEICAEETSWIRYLKGAIRSFKARRGITRSFFCIPHCAVSFCVISKTRLSSGQTFLKNDGRMLRTLLNWLKLTIPVCITLI